MKGLPVLIQFLVLSTVHAQKNEFAATAFYNEFRRIVLDGQNGFTDCRGAQRKSLYELLQKEYVTKCMLPLADSGKIIIPEKGRPYILFYFESDKIRLKLDQRSVNLREAVVTAYDKPLVAQTETRLVQNYPHSYTLYYPAGKEEQGASFAVFRQCIYFENGTYYLTFEVYGLKP